MILFIFIGAVLSGTCKDWKEAGSVGILDSMIYDPSTADKEVTAEFAPKHADNGGCCMAEKKLSAAMMSATMSEENMNVLPLLKKLIIDSSTGRTAFTLFYVIVFLHLYLRTRRQSSSPRYELLGEV